MIGRKIKTASVVGENTKICVEAPGARVLGKGGEGRMGRIAKATSA